MKKVFIVSMVLLMSFICSCNPDTSGSGASGTSGTAGKPAEPYTGEVTEGTKLSDFGGYLDCLIGKWNDSVGSIIAFKDDGICLTPDEPDYYVDFEQISYNRDEKTDENGFYYPAGSFVFKYGSMSLVVILTTDRELYCSVYSVSEHPQTHAQIKNGAFSADDWNNRKTSRFKID